MFTLRFTSEYRVVADDPMLMLATSPMASFSISVSNESSGPPVFAAGAGAGAAAGCGVAAGSSGGAALSPGASIPLKSAFISSCDNIPSMPLLPLSYYRRYSHSILIFAGTR